MRTPARSTRLGRSFFEAPTEELARALLGCCLVHEGPSAPCAGRIVETEAYLAEGDEASHSWRGPTARNASMFARPGTAYVYLIYGLHHCLNVVSAPEGRGEAVLLRAVEPLVGLDRMRARRGREAQRELCSGPAKLTVAMGVGPEHDGADLCRGGLGIWRPEALGEWDAAAARVASGPRVGIRRAAELPLRFWLEGSSWVSR